MAKLFTLKAGSRIPDEILRIAREERIKTARLEAIGTVNHLRLAYFNHASKKYEERQFDEQLEVTGVLGNITLKDGKPFLHAHGTFAKRDLSVIGGHLISAKVSPLLEVVITPTENKAARRFDEEVGLNVIYKIED